MTKVSLIHDTARSESDPKDIEALTHFLQWACAEARRIGLHGAARHMDRAIDEIDRAETTR